MEIKCFRPTGPFITESGATLNNIEIAYQTWGQINQSGSNVVWVCHALTANSNVFDWWAGLFGTDSLFNPKDYFIICANIIGSCYGSTGPLSDNTSNSKPYLKDFPLITVRDLSAAHQLLADHLDIKRIEFLIGGSLGGQQVLEWAVQDPERIKNIIPIATNARHSAWGIAFNEAQRMAVAADYTYQENQIDGGVEGLKAARAIAMLSYRHYDAYNQTQTDSEEQKLCEFKAASYQEYQGQKLADRFNAYSYVCLSKIMDSHHLGRGRAEIIDVLKSIKANALVIGVSSDVLFPPTEQKHLAAYIPNAVYSEIDSIFGHDGFLVEVKALSNCISKFIDKQNEKGN